MSFWEKVNKSLGVPYTRRDKKKSIPLACREDERGAVRVMRRSCLWRPGDFLSSKSHRKPIFHY